MRATTLCLLIGSTALAQTTLGVQQIGQEQSEWCWAANTQMIGALFGSHSLQQCVEANRRKGRSDCCTNPGSDACNDGDSFNAVSTYWGFPHSSDSALTFSQIKAEINGGQPVVSRWAWTGGGAHFITVDGYWTKSDGTNHVEVVNPLPKNQGDTEWVTYNVWKNGGTVDDGHSTGAFGDHTTTDTYFGFFYSPVCSYDFYGLVDDNYQQCYDQHSGRGEYPSAIANGCEGTFCQGYMGGAFHSSSNRPVAWNNSLGDFSDWVDNHSGSYRPEQITVLTGSNPVYSGILTQETNSWTTHYALDANSFQSTFNTLDSQGYRLRDLFGYNNNGTPEFSGTWVKESGGYYADHRLALSDLDSVDTTHRNQGYRLVRLSTYVDGSGVWRAAALWLPSTVNAYHWVSNATSSNFQSYYNTWVNNNGYSMAYVSKYSGYYNIIFTK